MMNATESSGVVLDGGATAGAGVVTAETLTNAQIHELHLDRAVRAVTAAHALGISYPTNVDPKPSPDRRDACREHCAAVWNERAAKARAVGRELQLIPVIREGAADLPVLGSVSATLRGAIGGGQ